MYDHDQFYASSILIYAQLLVSNWLIQVNGFKVLMILCSECKLPFNLTFYLIVIYENVFTCIYVKKFKNCNSKSRTFFIPYYLYTAPV